VKGYLLKTTFNQQLTEDLTQETMLKAILNFKTYKQTAKFSTWLITIATNLYRDYLRKNKNIIFDEELENKITNQLDSSENPEQILLQKDEFKDIALLLKKLPEEKRMTLILKHYYDYKYEEIAKMMDCPVGTVRSRIHDALRFLRAELKGGRKHV